MKEQDIIEEGRDAFFAERAYCPYHPDSPEWELYWTGYNEALADTQSDT